MQRIGEILKYGLFAFVFFSAGFSLHTQQQQDLERMRESVREPILTIKEEKNFEDRAKSCEHCSTETQQRQTHMINM